MIILRKEIGISTFYISIMKYLTEEDSLSQLDFVYSKHSYH